MRLNLYAVVLALGIGLPALAQDAPIREAIQKQLDAFQSDDFVGAFGFASPTIKGIFGSPENFGAMVQQGYPMVWRHRAVQMLELREVAGNLWQRVMITDAAGKTYLLDYMMIETAEGWQVNAVQLLPDQGAGA
jgi:Domain of unknown function (DUF4864)